MDADAEARDLVDRTRTRFPEEALATDQWLRERGWAPEEMTFMWIEAFADRTSEAVKRRDQAAIAAHTEFMAKEHRQGSESVRSLVDVAYAENLMWDLDISDRVWAWPHIARTVRALYEAMWGVPEDANA
ncbi:hypothetical protein J2X20_000460 [Pelomonas saccharophila]|uniref:DUF7674 domain-containing protein n=1 Tax=Roseateles saccharophilus TaxID=304 RepID=A0ABU1YI02_ROSSA|nr:hypothetical protein [Roseateles saccharophilus]MDR7267831.1 hypothetical protein [Roseateles saccharophilus]